MIKDHIAYRTSTLDIYDKHKKEYKTLGHVFLKETIVNGRPISVREAHPPESGFPYIELQAPRSDEPLFDGREHTAYVVEDINSAYAIDSNDHTLSIGKIKEYGGTKHYKIQKNGEEVEYREHSISL